MPSNEWRVLVADDEPIARRGVHQLLAPYQAFRVVGEARNGTETLAAIETLHPHVVFLDIQMPGFDGFEVIRRRGVEQMPALVFLTAYEEHALRAFDAQALDYLVKPVSESRFAMTIRRLTRHLTLAGHPETSTIAVTTRRGTRLLSLADIDWVEAADNYARVWIGERNWLVRESLNSLEERFNAQGFLRVHRQALVRLSAIRALKRGDPSSDVIVELTSGARVPVSRRRRSAVAQIVKNGAHRLTRNVTGGRGASAG